MPSSVVRRSTILIPGTGGRESADVAHLHIVLTDTCAAGYNLLVPIQSIHKNRQHDRTCILGVDDHSFIKHPSYVAYYNMRVQRLSAIMKQLKDNYFKEHEAIDDRIFALVCAGVEKSQHSAPRYQRYFATGILSENNAC
jgi:hypothetical protein